MITLYIDGLFETIRTAFARYQESVHPREMNFKSRAHFAKSEGETYRARTRNLSQGRVHLRENGTKNHYLPLLKS